MKLVLALTAASLGAYLVLAAPVRSVPLDERIHDKERQIQRATRAEGVLTTTVARLGTRVEALSGQLRDVELRLARVQQDLDRRTEQLLRLRERLRRAREQLEQLRPRLALAHGVMATRLVEIYKADEPDAPTVVLEADGFADLLERAEFLDRSARQDTRIFDRVRRLRDEARSEAARLAALEQRIQRAATALLVRRDHFALTRERLATARAELRETRADRNAVLARVRRSRA